MRRLLLALTTVLSGLQVLGIASVHAITLSYTSHIGANGTNCSVSGYISPSTDTRNAGDVLTITFDNEQVTPLQIRNFPGGNFTVPGNGTATKTFTANESFTYEAWLTSPVCKKASATITVNHLPQPPAPAPGPTPAPMPTPNPEPNPVVAPQPPDQNLNNQQSTTTEATASEIAKDLPLDTKAKSTNKIWFLFAALLIGLTLFVLWLLRRKKAKSRNY